MIKRFTLTVAGVCLCGLAVSCASGPVSHTSGVIVRPFGGSASSGGATGSAGGEDMPTPPRDAQYTIYCQSITGPNHVDESRALRQSLLAGTDMKGWYLVHATDKSTLYYGFYASIDPRDARFAKQGRRALDDLERIRTMTDSQGDRPFSTSLPVPLDTPDPTANPAWDLTRTGGYYSLAIAVYKDSPDRKQAAVDSVRAARAQGVEAYYFHAETASFVCVGSWPKSSATESDATDQNTDPNAPLVVTTVPLPEQVTQQLTQNGDKVVTPKLEPTDPSLIEAMRKFPEFSTNGDTLMHPMVDPATGQDKMVPSSSYLVKVPHQDENGANVPMADGMGGATGDTGVAGGDLSPPPTAAPSVSPTAPSPTDAPGMGGLKSLGN